MDVIYRNIIDLFLTCSATSVISVMNETVSKGLKLVGSEAAETALFIEMVDKMFDCLNMSLLSKGK